MPYTGIELEKYIPARFPGYPRKSFTKKYVLGYLWIPLDTHLGKSISQDNPGHPIAWDMSG
jgi:hypothetical protein